jgi:hypothetical protein
MCTQIPPQDPFSSTKWKSDVYAQIGINPRRKYENHADITAPTPLAPARPLYTTKPPTIDTTAAANRARAAVEDVEPMLDAAPVIDVVAYTRLKSNVELL